MDPAEILAELSSRGISLVVNGDKLKCKGKKSSLTPDLLETLRERKAELVPLLEGICFCLPPMPPADIGSPACDHCVIACWCATYGQC
jgi:TubC N-terminal docking domain